MRGRGTTTCTSSLAKRRISTSLVLSRHAPSRLYCHHKSNFGARPGGRAGSLADMPCSMQNDAKTEEELWEEDQAVNRQRRKRIPVTFEVKCEITEPGDTLLITGDAEELGSWNSLAAIPMTTSNSTWPVRRPSRPVRSLPAAFRWPVHATGSLLSAPEECVLITRRGAGRRGRRRS